MSRSLTHSALLFDADAIAVNAAGTLYAVQGGDDPDEEEQQYWVYFGAETAQPGELDARVRNYPAVAANSEYDPNGAIIAEMTQIKAPGADARDELVFCEVVGPFVRAEVEVSTDVQGKCSIWLCSDRPFKLVPTT